MPVIVGSTGYFEGHIAAVAAKVVPLHEAGTGTGTMASEPGRGNQQRPRTHEIVGDKLGKLVANDLWYPLDPFTVEDLRPSGANVAIGVHRREDPEQLVRPGEIEAGLVATAELHSPHLVACLAHLCLCFLMPSTAPQLQTPRRARPRAARAGGYPKAAEVASRRFFNARSNCGVCIVPADAQVRRNRDLQSGRRVVLEMGNTFEQNGPPLHAQVR